MSYDPFYPYSQPPYQPLYQVTKSEIETSILSLQEKLRRRRQIDRQLELNIAENLSPPYPSYYDPYANYIVNTNLEASRKAMRSISQDNLVRDRMADSYAQEEYLQKMERIEKLKLQQELLHRSKEVPYYASEPKGTDLDDQLLKKYQNGSKAREYYQDLQHQNRRYIAYEDKSAAKQPTINQKSNMKTPYDKLQYDSQTKQYESQINKPQTTATNLKHTSMKSPYDKLQYEQQYKHQKSPQVKRGLERQFNSIHYKQQNRTPRKTPTKNDQEKYFKKNEIIRQSYSPIRSMKRAAYSAPKINKLKKSINISTNRKAKQGKSQSDLHDFQVTALKKIENRLKLSQIIFEDSQFKNKKHEQNHLFNKYENECKIRKEIKVKINNHPLILRKHAMVV